jgi:hypothetical protein
MTNGNITSFDRRLTKLEKSRAGVRALWGEFSPPYIVAREGENVDQIIKEMEARGELPTAGKLPPGQIRVIVYQAVKPRDRSSWPSCDRNRPASGLQD